MSDGEEPRIDIIVNIRKSLYDKLEDYSKKNMYVPGVANLVREILNEWDVNH